MELTVDQAERVGARLRQIVGTNPSKGPYSVKPIAMGAPSPPGNR